LDGCVRRCCPAPSQGIPLSTKCTGSIFCSDDSVDVDFAVSLYKATVDAGKPDVELVLDSFKFPIFGNKRMLRRVKDPWPHRMLEAPQDGWEGLAAEYHARASMGVDTLLEPLQTKMDSGEPGADLMYSNARAAALDKREEDFRKCDTCRQLTVSHWDPAILVRLYICMRE
jgi:hypothetical protein